MKCEKKLDDLFVAIREQVEQQLEDKLYPEDRRWLPTTEVIDQTITDYLTEIISNEKILAKLAKLAQKELMSEHNKNETIRKNDLKKSKKLYAILKGNIPCLCDCGYTQFVEKENFLYGLGSGEYICKECSEKLKNEGKNVFDIFRNNSLYKKYNIE